MPAVAGILDGPRTPCLAARIPAFANTTPEERSFAPRSARESSMTAVDFARQPCSEALTISGCDSRSPSAQEAGLWLLVTAPSRDPRLPARPLPPPHPGRRAYRRREHRRRPLRPPFPSTPLPPGRGVFRFSARPPPALTRSVVHGQAFRPAPPPPRRQRSARVEALFPNAGWDPLDGDRRPDDAHRDRKLRPQRPAR